MARRRSGAEPSYRQRYYAMHKVEILAKQKDRKAAEFAADPKGVRAKRYGMTKAWAEKHPERMRELQDQWRRRNRDTFLASRRASYKRRQDGLNALRRDAARHLRGEMIAAYGGSCACCGETRPAFLTTDHIYRDGQDHRKSLGRFGGKGGTHAVYLDLKKRGWPRDRYRCFCMNCNFATRAGEPCPHTTEHVEKMLTEVFCS